MGIEINPANRALTTQAKPMAIYFLLVLVVLRFGLRTGLGLETQGWGLSPTFVNNIFVVFAVGLFMVQRAEMVIRARRLIATEIVQASASRERTDRNDSESG
jgi:hypothetical protein